MGFKRNEGYRGLGISTFKVSIEKYLKLTALAEAFRAVRAGEGLFLIVEALVGDQVGMAYIALSALRTSVRLRAAVDVQMTRQVAALDERLAADVAAKALILLLLLCLKLCDHQRVVQNVQKARTKKLGLASQKRSDRHKPSRDYKIEEWEGRGRGLCIHVTKAVEWARRESRSMMFVFAFA